MPRDRFSVYQRDLHSMANQVLDEDSLVSGDQYTYAELADALLERVGNEVLPDLDVLVTSYWTPEFDPEFSAFGPYLHHRWSLDCQSFDAIDQGSLSPTLALTVLVDFLAADAACAHGLLLGVEQTTMPQAIGANLARPWRSSAGVVRLSREAAGARAQIQATAWFGEQHMVEQQTRIDHMLIGWQQEFGIGEEPLTVVLRRNTFIYRSLRFWCDRAPQRWAYEYLTPRPSCMHLFEWLAGEHATGWYAFVDEDVESLAAVAVLVRVP
ncbi:MAG TPA: hypothetical protein VGJ60_09775 [Chloroflexota bacterium]